MSSNAHHRPLRRLALALAAAGLLAASLSIVDRPSGGNTPAAATAAGPTFDPLLDTGPGSVCGPIAGASMKIPAAWLVAAVAKTETTPFQPQPMKAAGGDVPLYKELGTLAFPITTRNASAQAYFNQGLRLSFAFNHAEAQRAFQAAQKLDPNCAACFWGEALILGPNINVPMMPEANAPALAALEKAVALKARAGAKERALIEALEKRYSADPKAERPALDAAYADAMKQVAARFPADDTIRTLYVESAMDTQPWDYWEPGGATPKGRGAEIVSGLETVLKRNPTHPGAIHLYIHAVEASTAPERALPYADRLAALMPGAGHIVHMPAHIYYRVGQYRRSLDLNKRAVAVDERYFQGSPSDPLYKSAYYPHNIHFVMVSAQMGGDGATAVDAAKKLDAAVPAELAMQFQIMEPVKAAPYTTQLTFADPDTVLALPAPDEQARAGAGDVPLRPGHGAGAQEGHRGRASRGRRDRRARGQGRLQALRAVGRAGPGDRRYRALRRHRADRRRGGRPRTRRGRLRGGGRPPGQAELHRAAVLVLPGAPVARRRAPAPGPARRRRARLPRFARERAQQRLGPRRAGRGLQAQGRPQRRGGGAAGVCEGLVRAGGRAGPGAAVSASGR